MAEEAIFGFVLETIGNLVIQEAQFLDGVEEQVKNVQQELNLIRWFLRDTASANPDTQKWVLEFVLVARNLAYEADYLIESYAFKIASRRRGGIRGNLKRFAGLLNDCYHRHKIGSDIDKLLSKITDLTNSFDQYGIRQIIENKYNGASRRPLLRRTYSIVNDEDELFVGSDDAINNLAEKLVSDQYRTLSLHGMGGLGKTTLARKVYHHPIVKKHFDGFSWVSISQLWEKEDVLRAILIKLMGAQRREEIQKLSDDELVRELSDLLKDKKCLLVLDDVWSSDAWESIKHALPIREDGSKVFMTTRNVDVAKFMDGHGYLYSPPLLTADESWELLCKKALGGQDSQKIKKMEQIGKEMVSQCGGLPLAVVALGGILSSKHSYDEWKNVGDNVQSYLLKDGIEGILSLSYDDLPFQLKPCFLYLSQYAEDAEIEVETLYHYWIAEGMVSLSDVDRDRNGSNETMMDVAEHYLSELAERSMVFVKKEEEHSHTRFKSCRLPYLMRDLGISKAKEEKFLESIDFRNIGDGDEASSVSRTTSRLFIYLDDERDGKRFIPPAKTVSANLRSFTLVLGKRYFGKRPSSLKFKFREFMMLRILSLDGLSDSSDRVYQMKFLSLFGKLVHLRYLRLRNMSFLNMSSSISNLKQLQTLDLRDSYLYKMPNVLFYGKLAQLHHLYLPKAILYPSADLLGFDGLHKLEILEGFDNEIYNVKHLSTLTSLRKLQAIVRDKLEDLETFIDDVSKLTQLQFLDLKIINVIDLSSEKGMAIIRNILCCNNLVNLKIKGKLSKLPEYDGMFCRNLRSLELDGCLIEKDPLSTLERLPNLRSLIFGRSAFVGKEMTCHASGFPQLRILSFNYLMNLEKWEIEDGAMPNLSQLYINYCSRLEMIPPGLRFTTSLKDLYIYDMPEKFNARVRVKNYGQEGADFDKVRHVQTITIL